MRFNDKELIYFSKDNNAQIEGVLHHMKPTNSEWYQQSSYKERYFRLIANCLFYYKINDPEPSGVIILENVHIAYEQKNLAFAFSITFKVNNKLKDNDGKHLFSCRCESDVNKWVSMLKTSSYDYWRSQFHILQAKISMKTGKDPVLDYIKHQNINGYYKEHGKKGFTKKATFHSHIELSYQEIDNNGKIVQTNALTNKPFSSSSKVEINNSLNNAVGDLIDL